MRLYNRISLGKVRAGFVRGGSRGGGLPARDVYGLEVLGHLGNLDGVQGAKRVGSGAGLLMALHESPQLASHGIRGVFNGQRAALLNHVSSGVRASHVGEARELEELLDGGDFGIVFLLFGSDKVGGRHGEGLEKEMCGEVRRPDSGGCVIAMTCDTDPAKTTSFTPVVD